MSQHRRPRVLYVNWVYGEDGGAIHVREVLRELELLGCDVRVLWHQGVPESIGTAPAAYSRKPRFLAWLLHEPRELADNLPQVVREIREARQFMPDWILCRYKAGKWTSALVCRLQKIPMILEMNSLYEDEALVYGSEYLHYSPLMRWMERLLVRRSEGVTVVSHPQRENLHRRYGVLPGRVLVNPNGARLPPLPNHDARKASREGLKIGEGPLVVFAGSFQRFHGSALLASAAERLLRRENPASFVILGDGPTRSPLEDLAGRFPERVRLVGRLPVEETRAIVGACDIGVMPDSNPYGSPIKVVEYMAAGLGIVAPDYPPIRELIDDGVSGLLFEPGDEEALLGHLELLIRDKSLRGQMGVAARAEVHSHLSWRHNAERVLRFAQERINGLDASCDI
jgi:glycosyltransferase involved in cell wall biosynthesis